MYPRTEYEMTDADLKTILDACKPVPYMLIGGHAPSSPQENANRAWAALGAKMGFDPMSVQPTGKGNRFFSAVPSETEAARTERLARAATEAKERRIAALRTEISERDTELAALLGTAREEGDAAHPDPSQVR